MSIIGPVRVEFDENDGIDAGGVSIPWGDVQHVRLMPDRQGRPNLHLKRVSEPDRLLQYLVSNDEDELLAMLRFLHTRGGPDPDRAPAGTPFALRPLRGNSNAPAQVLEVSARWPHSSKNGLAGAVEAMFNELSEGLTNPGGRYPVLLREHDLKWRFGQCRWSDIASIEWQDGDLVIARTDGGRHRWKQVVIADEHRDWLRNVLLETAAERGGTQQDRERIEAEAAQLKARTRTDETA